MNYNKTLLLLLATLCLILVSAGTAQAVSCDNSCPTDGSSSSTWFYEEENPFDQCVGRCSEYLDSRSGTYWILGLGGGGVKMYYEHRDCWNTKICLSRYTEAFNQEKKQETENSYCHGSDAWIRIYWLDGCSWCEDRFQHRDFFCNG